MQVILWVVLGATLAVAQLVVRHRRLVGSVELSAVRTVDLPGGVVVGVRLPKGWQVERDPGEHPGDPDAPQEFRAAEPAGGVGGTADPEGGDFGRELVVRFDPLLARVSAQVYLQRMGNEAHRVALPGGDGGPMPVAGVEGCWAVFAEPARLVLGQEAMYHPTYIAVGVVPAGPATPGPVAVTVLLACPPGDGDARGDRDLLRRLAAAVTVDVDRAPAVPTIHPPETVR